MTNIHNYTPNIFKFRINTREYWDFYLANGQAFYTPYSGITSGSCFVTHFDFNNSAIYGTGSTSATTIFSTETWTGATNTGVTNTTIGLTGIDNGLISFIKTSADTQNIALLSALTGSTLVIPSGDTRFRMTAVSGATGQYQYPMTFVTDTGTTGNYMDLCGGFYQGFYKLDGDAYQTLPNRVPKGWVAEFWLKKSDPVCSGITATTLNDIRPDNKGIFFYIGTRAENKFWDVFEGLNTGCTSGCTVPIGCTGTTTTFCTVEKENNYTLPNGISLSSPSTNFIDIDNQFVIYNNAVAGTTHYGVSYPAGEQAPNFTGGSITITSTTQTVADRRNPFLIYCRGCGNNSCSCSGSTSDCQTIDTYSGATSGIVELDTRKDIIDNAIAFQIKDDGSIGYKRLIAFTGACSADSYSTGVTVTEKYSEPSIILNNTWINVAIRFYAYEEYTGADLLCGKPRLGKLGIYVDGKLKVWSDDFIEVVPRRLNEHPSKQVAVPYNISLGGGSQGLLESMTFDGQDPDDIGLHIEENFAGTFIGSMSQFKLYACDLSWVDIENNYNSEKDRYGIPVPTDPIMGIYYGKVTTPTFGVGQLGTLTFLPTNNTVNISVPIPLGAGYCYILLPATSPQPSEFRDSFFGCTGFSVPVIELPSVNIAQTTGFITYKVYRTFYPTLSDISIWLCQ